MFNVMFFLNAMLLGVGLAMDTFSVGIVNGLNEPKMSLSKMMLISCVYAFFQFAFPMTGWICVHTVVTYFSVVEKFIPWAGFIALMYVGLKMIIDYAVEIKKKNAAISESDGTDVSENNGVKLTFGLLLLQGIATALDALSVGFTNADKKLFEALVECLVIGAVTFCISFCGVFIGKKGGAKFSGKAPVIGGVILICIGIKLLIEGVFF